MAKRTKMVMLLAMVLGLVSTGCAPNTFVRSAPGWKVIELNDGLEGNYADAWQKTVDTIARNYDIQMLDRDSGYLRTAWAYGISGGIYNRYRGRITVKYPVVKDPRKIEIKTDAQWLDNINTGLWFSGWDRTFQRDVFTELSGRLGRTVSRE